MSYFCFGFRTSGNNKSIYAELVFKNLGTGWICALLDVFATVRSWGWVHMASFERGARFRARSRFVGDNDIDEDWR